MTEWWQPEVASGDHLVQAPVKQVHLEQMVWNHTQARLNISREDSTTSMGSLFQCSDTLSIKTFFLIFIWNFLCFYLCLLPLVLPLGRSAMKSVWLCLLHTHPQILLSIDNICSQFPPLQAKQAQLLEAFFLREMLQAHKSPFPVVPCLSWSGEFRAGHSPSDVASLGQSRWGG